MAHGLGIPLIGVSTGEAPRRIGGGAAGPLVAGRPNGSARRAAGPPSVALPAGEEPEIEHGETLIALDLEDRALSEALERGEAVARGSGTS